MMCFFFFFLLLGLITFLNLFFSNFGIFPLFFFLLITPFFFSRFSRLETPRTPKTSGVPRECEVSCLYPRFCWFYRNPPQGPLFPFLSLPPPPTFLPPFASRFFFFFQKFCPYFNVLPPPPQFSLPSAYRNNPSPPPPPVSSFCVRFPSIEFVHTSLQKPPILFSFLRFLFVVSAFVFREFLFSGSVSPLLPSDDLFSFVFFFLDPAEEYFQFYFFRLTEPT